MNEKQRLPYENKAAEDKKRYEDEKASYNVSTVRQIYQLKSLIINTIYQADAEEEESG